MSRIIKLHHHTLDTLATFKLFLERHLVGKFDKSILTPDTSDSQDHVLEISTDNTTAGDILIEMVKIPYAHIELVK